MTVNLSTVGKKTKKGELKFTHLTRLIKLWWIALSFSLYQVFAAYRNRLPALVIGAVVSRVNFGVIMGHTSVKHRPINDMGADQQAKGW